MSTSVRAKGRKRAGFTMVEIVCSIAVLGVLWYSLSDAMLSGTRSQQVVLRAASELSEVRTSNNQLLEDLRGTSPDAMSLETLPDGTHQLVLQHPIRVEGAQAWGLRTPGHALDDATTGEADWSIRYVVRDGAQTPGAGARSLLREVLDAAGDIQSEEVVVTELQHGDADNPAFSVIQDGEMWKVHIAQANSHQGPEGPGTVFHVRMRN